MCILFKNKLIKPTTGMCDNIIQLQNEYCISEKKKKDYFFLSFSCLTFQLKTKRSK
jgi:hypothetical protein